MDLPHFGAHVAGFEQAEDIFEFRSAEEPDAAQILLGAMEHPAGVRGTVRIEQPRVPVGKPERQAEEIQPVLLGRERGFLTDAFPDQIAARHEHPGGDFRAGEVTGAAAEQGFTVHTEKGCAFGAEDLTQAGRELVAIFFKSFPFMDRADFAAADIEGRFFLLRRRPRGTFPAQPDTAEEHEGGFLGGLGFGFAPEGIQEPGAPPFGEPILDGHVGIFEDFKAFVEQVKRVLRRFFAEEDRLQPQCVPPHHGARADLGLAEQGIEIDAGQGREAVGIEHREFEDPEVVVGQGEGRVALGLPQGIGEQVIGHFGPAHAGIAERDGGESPEHQLGVGGHRRTGDDGLEGFQGVILAAHVGVEDAEVLAEDLGGHDVPFQFRRADGGFDHAEGVGEVAGVGGGGCRLEHELRFEEGQYGLMGALLEHFVAFERLLEVPPDEVHQDEEGRDPGIQLLVVQRLEQLTILFPLGLGDADAQGAPLAAPGGQGEVLFDLHGGGRAGHGVLKNAADVGGALVLAQFGDVDAVDQNLALVYGPDTGHRVQHGGFTRTVAADDSDEVALIQLQVQPVQGRFLIDGTCIEGLGDILDLKHFSHPPSFLQSALRSTGSSSKAPPGRWPPRRR